MEQSSSGGSVGSTSDGPKMDLGFAQVKLKSFRYRWTIQNFKSFYDEKKTVESPLFSPSRNEDDDLCLFVRPSTSSPDEHLSLFLVNNSESKMSVKFKVVLIDSEGEKGYEMGNEAFYDIEAGQHQGCEEFIRWEEIFQESEFAGLLSNDELEIICSGAIFDGLFYPSNPGEMTQFEKNQETQHQRKGFDYQQAELGRYSDVTLLVGKRGFQCHKLVLAAGSSVISAMMEQDQKDQKLRLKMTDVDAEVVEKLLEYFYSGKVTGIEKVAEKLLAAASKYAVFGLMALCEEEIASKLSVKNAVRILLLADRHSSKELKAGAVELICGNCRQVSQTEAWKQLGKSNPELILETFEALALAHEEEIGGLDASGRFSKLANDYDCATGIGSSRADNSETDWRYAKVEVTPFRFTWTIKDFTSFYNEKRIMESPTCLVTENGGTAELSLMARPSTKFPTKYLGLFILNHAELNQHITFELAVIGSKGEKKRKRGRALSLSSPLSLYRRIGKSGLGWDDFIRWEDIFIEAGDLLVNDEFKILCSGAVFDGITSCEPPPADVILLKRELKQKNNFSELLESGRFSDVTLVVNAREFAAHKVVLANSSTVFAAMFEREQQRDKGDRLEITDVDADILQDLLKFIYTGQLGDIGPFVEKLLAAAEKYAVLDLKGICEAEILSKLCVVNAARILLLGHLHSSKQLKAEAMNLICRNPKQVSQSEEWKSLTHSRPELIVEAFEALAVAHQEEIELSRLAVC